MFSNKKNKTFNYNSRFSKDEIKEENETFSIKRETPAKWKNTRETGAGKRRIGLPLLLVLLGIIIAVMYYLEYKIQ